MNYAEQKFYCLREVRSVAIIDIEAESVRDLLMLRSISIIIQSLSRRYLEVVQKLSRILHLERQPELLYLHSLRGLAATTKQSVVNDLSRTIYCAQSIVEFSPEEFLRLLRMSDKPN